MIIIIMKRLNYLSQRIKSFKSTCCEFNHSFLFVRFPNYLFFHFTFFDDEYILYFSFRVQQVDSGQNYDFF